MKSHRVHLLRLVALFLILLVGTVDIAHSARAQTQGRVLLHTVGRGHPWLNLSDGMALATAYTGQYALKRAMAAGTADPLSLATADFDEDGVPDLVVGYGEPLGLAMHRGNVDAIYPNALEAQERKANGTGSTAPFLSPARTFALPVAPDFLGAGDFDNDGHRDVVAATRGGMSLTLLPGDGEGGFGAPEIISLPGEVTALTVGDVNRRDGLADVVVGVVDLSGFSKPDRSGVVVFEGPEGALRAEPEVLDAPAEVTGLAIGQLDDHYAMDLAVAAGQELLIIQGRDRKLSLDSESRASIPPATVTRHSLPFESVALALGNFAKEAYPLEVALLDDTGTVHILDPATGTRITEYAIRNTQSFDFAQDGYGVRNPTLLRVNLSSLPTDDLLILKRDTRELHVLNTQYSESKPLAHLTAASPIAGLPMRLNTDALDDLVLLTEVGPVISASAALNTFVVNSTGDEGDAYGDDGMCDICNNPEANPPVGPCDVCTLRAAIMQANADEGKDYIDFDIPGSGPHTIEIGGVLWAKEPVAIDGTTQPGYGDSPVIEVSGSSQSAFYISGGDSLVRGLVVNSATSHGIQIDTHGNTVIEGNYVGTDPSGEVAKPNGQIGVVILDTADNTIGGTTAAARNLISGNSGHGVQIGSSTAATRNKIWGNRIGPSARGSAPLGNGQLGIVIGYGPNNDVGGDTENKRNIIVASTAGHGVQIAYSEAQGNRIAGNWIGYDVLAGSMGNNFDGVTIVGAGNNTVGGAAGAEPGQYCSGSCNVVASNGGDGVQISALTLRHLQFPAGSRSIRAANPVPLLTSTASTADHEIQQASGNLIQGNRIGTDPAGTVAQGNGGVGVLIEGGSSNVVGGSVAAAGNLVAYNHSHGVVTEGSDGLGNQVQGYNVIIDNSEDGIHSELGSVCVQEAGNEIHDNGGWGIWANGDVEVRDGTLSNVHDNEKGGIYAGGMIDLPTSLVIEDNGGPGIIVQGAGAMQSDELLLNGVTVRRNNGEGVGVGLDSGGNYSVVLVGDSVIADNAGDGIYTEMDSVYVQGTGNGVHGNGGWGIQACGDIEIHDGALSSIHDNGDGGLWSCGLVEIPTGFLVEDNGGDGIVAGGEGAGQLDHLWLTSVTVRRNGGAGVVAGFNETYPIALLGDNAILDNGGDGVNNAGGSVYVQGTGNEVHDNGGWGIWAYADVEIQTGALNSVNGNGAGGVRAGSRVEIPPGFVVEDNGGPGIIVGGVAAGYLEQLMLTNVTVRGNGGAGIGTLLYPVVLLGGNEIANNVGAGIHSEAAPIYSQGAGNRIHDNGGWGIHAPNGSVEIQGGTRVNQNGLGGIISTNLLMMGNGNQVMGNHGWGLQVGGGGGRVLLRNLAITNNDHGGISVTDNNIEGWGLIVDGNGGTGIMSDDSRLDLSVSRICDNGGWGFVVTGGSFDLQQVEVCRNGLGGIYDDSAQAAKEQGGEGRVTIESASGVPATVTGSMINANQGDGVRYEGGAGAGGLTIQESNVVANSAYGVRNLTTSATVTIRDNWWGETDGPGGAGPGTGDEITGTVTFTPWLTQPVSVMATAGDDPFLASRGTTVSNPIYVQNWLVPTDTVTVILSDTLGWLLTPTTFTVTLQEGVGVSVPVSLTVPSGATIGTSDDVTATVVSHSAPAVDDTVNFQVLASLASDLAMTQESLPHSVLVGEQVTYTLVISNHGPDVASGVRVTDTLPAEMTFYSVATSQGSCSEQEGRVTCSLGTLGSTHSATVTISVAPTMSGILNNVASVAANEYDPHTPNNFDQGGTVVNLADLSIKKSTGVDSVWVGTPLTYTLIVINAGPAMATGVTVSDTLPVSTVFGTVAITSGNCDEVGGVVNCDVGELAPGGIVTSTIVVTPTAEGNISNTARVVAEEPDYPFTNLTTVSTMILGETPPANRIVYLPLVMKN